MSRSPCGSCRHGWGWRLRVAWGIAIIGGLVENLQTTIGVSGGGVDTFYWLSPLNFLFLFGIAARQAALWRGWRRPGLWAAAGALLFIGVGMENIYFPIVADMTRTLLYGAAAAVAIAGAAAWERQRGTAIPGWLLLLGAASYSIYLVHFPLLSLLAKLFGLHGLRTAISAQLAFVIVVVLATVGGIAFHLLVERPILRRLGFDKPRCFALEARPFRTSGPFMSKTALITGVTGAGWGLSVRTAACQGLCRPWRQTPGVVVQYRARRPSL